MAIREIILTGACLSIPAASTIETYERCWDSAFQDIGMTNRLFILFGRPLVGGRNESRRKHISDTSTPG